MRLTILLSWSALSGAHIPSAHCFDMRHKGIVAKRTSNRFGPAQA
jgi:hypothetical protein